MNDEAQQWADLAPADLMTFRVSLPAIQSAVTIDGQEGGLRIKIDVCPQDRMAALAFVEAARGRVLRLVVVDDGEVTP